LKTLKYSIYLLKKMEFKMKAKYRIRNWNHYNKSLIQRGSITVWFSEDTIKKWSATNEVKKKGRPKIYSDDAILTALIIRSVFHLPLRALQGFLSSLIIMLSIGLSIPCYTQICRRAKSLGQNLERLSRKQISDVVIDSTGLKVYGEGEWKVRQHGYGKRRTWRKLHLAVCPDSNEIIFEILTDNKVADCEIYPKFLMNMSKSVKRTYGDGAYDTERCYIANREHGSIPIIPPNRNAVFRGNDLSMEMRNTNLLEISGLGGGEQGRKLWKKLKGYHRRSLVETAMFRFKRLFGSDLKNRLIETQRAETRAKCEALNIITKLGMPRSQLIAA
jgi:Transposase DDE domain